MHYQNTFLSGSFKLSTRAKRNKRGILNKNKTKPSMKHHLDSWAEKFSFLANETMHQNVKWKQKSNLLQTFTMDLFGERFLFFISLESQVVISPAYCCQLNMKCNQLLIRDINGKEKHFINRGNCIYLWNLKINLRLSAESSELFNTRSLLTVDTNIL